VIGLFSDQCGVTKALYKEAGQENRQDANCASLSGPGTIARHFRAQANAKADGAPAMEQKDLTTPVVMFYRIPRQRYGHGVKKI